MYCSDVAFMLCLYHVDYDDFIVDDEGQPISKMKKKKMVHNDAYVSH